LKALRRRSERKRRETIAQTGLNCRAFATAIKSEGVGEDTEVPLKGGRIVLVHGPDITDGMNYAKALKVFRRAYWQLVLDEAGGRIGRAAKIAGINRTHLYKIVRALKLKANLVGRHRGNWGNI
jgi:DNA-binding NtrC family response regulator